MFWPLIISISDDFNEGHYTRFFHRDLLKIISELSELQIRKGNIDITEIILISQL